MLRFLSALGTSLTKIESWLALAGMAMSAGLFAWLANQWGALASQGWAAVILVGLTCGALLVIALTGLVRLGRPREPAVAPVAQNWVQDGTPTFVEVHINRGTWQAKPITQSNIFDTAVSMLGTSKTDLEIFVIFDKCTIVRRVACMCDNRLEEYSYRPERLNERYAIIYVLGVELPCNIRLDFNP